LSITTNYCAVKKASNFALPTVPFSPRLHHTWHHGLEGASTTRPSALFPNIAARLCDEAKPGQILVSLLVFTNVEGTVNVEPVGEFELKGISRPLRLTAYSTQNPQI